jgi:hypothetical protein
MKPWQVARWRSRLPKLRGPGGGCFSSVHAVFVGQDP